jgi:hypothetical protein
VERPDRGTFEEADRLEGSVDPDEIWRTIVKADEALKYARADKADRRREQAVERLRTALAEAEAIGNEALAEQARTRLRDLGLV